VSTMLLLPLDNIKVRLQVNEGMHSKTIPTPSSKSSTAASSNAGTAAKNPHQRMVRVGAIRMFRGVIKYEGVRGLYQGLMPAVAGSAVSWGGFFYIYESMKRQLRHSRSQNNAANCSKGNMIRNEGEGAQEFTALSSLDNFLLGTASGVVIVFVTNPVWLIKLRLQLQMKQASQNLDVKSVTQYNGVFDAFRKIVRADGFLGLYKGIGPALILTSHGGVQFVVYEFLRKYFHYARAVRSTEYSVAKRFEDSLGYLTIGAISKMVASTFTYPLQVVKSRMQQPPSSIELTSTGDVRVVKRDYAGLLGTVLKIWRQEGIVGFYKGALPNAVRVAPNAALTFLIYESVMDILQDV